MRNTRFIFGIVIIITVGCAGSQGISQYAPAGVQSSIAYESEEMTEAAPSPIETSAEPETVAVADAGEPPIDEARDRFQNVGVNSFVAATHDPFSTFAADVDTASYDVLRQWMYESQLPPAASVRLEEYVNYFDYEYPEPSSNGSAPFSISLATASHPLRENAVVLRVGIQAEEVSTRRRPRANLVFLVDVSGSMAGNNKLDLVKVLLSSAVNNLGRDNTISIVTYAGSTAVRLPPTPISQRRAINRVIRHLRSGGGTSGAAGIELAYQQAEAAFLEDGINQVILCTDGDFNIGPHSDAALVDLIEEKRRTGITLTALGFGRGNLNDSMMEAVTNAGNGIYSVIYNADRAEEFIDDDLLPSIVHVAKDMKIQVEFNPQAVEAYRLLGYVNRAIADEDFRDDMVDAGEVGAGHRVTALYEVVLNGSTVPSPAGAPHVETGSPIPGQREIGGDELVRVKVRYKDVGAFEQDPAHEVVSALAIQGAARDFSSADSDFQWAIAVATFAELLQESPFVVPEALDLISRVTEAQSRRDDSREEFARIVELTRLFLESQGRVLR